MRQTREPNAVAVGRDRPPERRARRDRLGGRSRRGRWRTAVALIFALAAAVHAAPANDGRVHITYWEKWVGFQADAMRRVVDRFNRSQTHVFVEYHSISAVERKTLIATAGGDPPDVAGLWTQNIATYADADALMPLDDFIRADGTTPTAWLARYYPAYAKLCTHAGRIYAGISTPGVFAFYWNKTLFRQAGLDPDRPPRTLAELDEYNRRLTRVDPKTGEILQTGFLPEDPGWWPWVFFPWFGGQLFDGRDITLGTDPRNLAAMKWVASISERLGLDRLRRFKAGFGQQASPDAAFFAGKVAMVIQGVYYDNYIRQYKPGLDYGVGAWPQTVPGVDDFTMVEADMLVIPRGSRHPHAAWAFIKYVNTANVHAEREDQLEGSELLCYLQGKNSPLRDWSPFFEHHHPNPHIAMFRALSASPHAVSVPDMGMWNEYERELVALFERVRLLVDPPERAIRYSQARMARSWARYRLSLVRHGQWPDANPAPP